MRYTWFLARRLAQAAVVIVLVSVVVFLLLQSLPGGPARAVLGAQATQLQIDTFNAEQGLDQPIWRQYLAYVGRMMSGDLGTSYTLNMPVTDLLVERLPKTLVLTGLSTLAALVIAVLLGLAQAARRRSLFDHTATGVAFVLYATPSFFFGMLAIIVFSELLGWLPALAPQGSTVAAVLGDPQALVLPVLTGAVTIVAVFSRYIRASTLANLSEDYVRTARAKGTSERRILVRHVLRNSLTPAIAMVGYQIPVMFGGALVVEQLFNYPGMGLLFWTSAQSSDFPVLLGCTLVISVATVLGSLLADILQSLVDPRVRSAR
ncbi:MAG TPA: ABC transporter permease [Cellulomonas sp.]